VRNKKKRQPGAWFEKILFYSCYREERTDTISWGRERIKENSKDSMEILG